MLLVDDSKELLDIFTNRLERMGCAVAAFETPSEALAWGTANDFDLLCSDYQLNASMTGLELAKALCDIKPNIGVMIISGNLGPQSPGAIADSWITLEKPVSKSTLRDMIVRMGEELAGDN